MRGVHDKAAKSLSHNICSGRDTGMGKDIQKSITKNYPLCLENRGLFGFPNTTGRRPNDVVDKCTTDRSKKDLPRKEEKLWKNKNSERQGKKKGTPSIPIPSLQQRPLLD